MLSSYVIGNHFEAFVKDQIRQGRYASASEAVRDGLRVLEDREKLRAAKVEELRKEIQRGEERVKWRPRKRPSQPCASASPNRRLSERAADISHISE